MAEASVNLHLRKAAGESLGFLWRKAKQPFELSCAYVGHSVKDPRSDQGLQGAVSTIKMVEKLCRQYYPAAERTPLLHDVLQAREIQADEIVCFVHKQ